MARNWVEIALTAACCAVGARHYIHMLQLESYQLPGYKRYLSRAMDRMFRRHVLVGVLFTILSFLMPFLIQPFTAGIPEKRGDIAAVVTLVLFIITASLLAYVDFRAPAKRPLVMTKRATRLYIALALLAFASCALIAYIGLSPYIIYAAVAYLVYAAEFIEEPIERRINLGYFNAARETLAARPDLIRIGITGSYGKTSTKFALRDILSVKYNVLATPSSFNTPMGVSSVINNKLKREHQVFIAEMGARHVGDIKEMCELVSPKYAVLVSVGEQHLDTFGSIMNIVNTKNEIMEALPEDGVGFFASDGEYCDRLYAKLSREKYRVGYDANRKPHILIGDVQVDNQGSRFTLTCSDGTYARCRTKLLGRHSIQNIALAASVARRLGLTMEEIARGIRRIEPVEHRLQLIPGQITVIDDAFNSNPAGSAEALNVLAGFAGRRFIVTPGMVEQGEREDQLNYAFGTQMPGKVDIAILVGPKRTRPIYEGMLDAGFDEDRIYVAEDLNEATGILRDLGRPGDVVLFENDLPDNYNE
ncbi:MAG: Mur ligase family protein [Christensenellales bacterium]|jgi:UDP-N-acetylmuramoyl-tripeptide--D-alanyl-D-alanine ligase